jgi:predicted Zn-dependent protease
MKFVFKLGAFVIAFVVCWLSLAQVNWMELLRVEKASNSIEEKITEILKESIERSEEVIKDEKIKSVIDSLVKRITEANSINSDELKVIIVENPQVNAFALPDNQLVIYTGLIADCENPEALSGVIAHELAHIELNHVMKKLIKEIGLSVLFTMTSNGSGEIVKQVTQSLTSSAYDRTLEEDADEKAFQYLVNANIDSAPLADFFYQLSLQEPSFASKLQWLNTHPQTKERAEKIIEKLIDTHYEFLPLIHDNTWNTLKQDLQNIENETL